MKRIILLFCMVLLSIGSICAQTARQNEELNALQNLYTLVENGTKVRYTQIYEDLGKSKEVLYEGLINFFKNREERSSNFKYREENNTIILTFQMSYDNVYSNVGFGHNYFLYMVVNWRIDIKDNRIRAIVDLTDYTQVHRDKTGILQKEYTDVVPLCVVPPFGKVKKEKHNEMYAQAFINSANKTKSLFYYLNESFKMLIKKAPEADTDW